MSRLVAFWSPSHAGASSLLLNTAAALSSRWTNLAAVDLNLTNPSLALYTDLLPHADPRQTCLARLMPLLDSGRLTPDELARHLLQGPGFPILPGILDIAAGSRLGEKHVQSLLQALRGRFDLVLADVTPALDSIACLPVLEMADLICLVVSPELASRFHARLHLLPLWGTAIQPKIALVLNRAGGFSPSQVAEELGVPVSVRVPHLSAMPGLIAAGRLAFEAQLIMPAMARYRAAVEELATLVARRG